MQPVTVAEDDKMVVVADPKVCACAFVTRPLNKQPEQVVFQLELERRKVPDDTGHRTIAF